MFTDVKNIAPPQHYLDTTTTVAAPASNRKVKGKFHKLFKPLLRILRTAKMSSGNGAKSIAHPNNVNLNNCTDLSFIAPTMAEALAQVVATSNASYEDYAVVIRKVAKDEEFLQSYFAEDPFSDATPYALDSSATKSQPATACECSHGFNCRQYHGEFKKYNDYRQIPLVLESSADDSFVPVHYVRTDNGTFFWTAEQAKLDADLMEPVSCRSHRQPAQAQWDNRALLY